MTARSPTCGPSSTTTASRTSSSAASRRATWSRCCSRRCEPRSEQILATRDTLLKGVVFPAQTVDEVTAFMTALTDPAAPDLAQVVPAAVPSGLSIDALGRQEPGPGRPEDEPRLVKVGDDDGWNEQRPGSHPGAAFPAGRSRYLSLTLAQVSRSVTVRLNTSAPGPRVDRIADEVAGPLELIPRARRIRRHAGLDLGAPHGDERVRIRALRRNPALPARASGSGTVNSRS